MAVKSYSGKSGFYKEKGLFLKEYVYFQKKFPKSEYFQLPAYFIF